MFEFQPHQRQMVLTRLFKEPTAALLLIELYNVYVHLYQVYMISFTLIVVFQF